MLPIHRPGATSKCPRGINFGMRYTRDLTDEPLNRYKVHDPLLVTATVSKHDIVAVKLGREEEEVITFRPRIMKIEKLSRKKG
jgi:hypothetical protein